MESMIWGKNRHFFGGIAPSNMRTFKTKVSETDNGVSVILTVLGPADTTNADGQVLCTSDKTVIRRSIDHYPVDEFDGDLVATVKSNATTQTIVDNDVEGGNWYYYAAFPCSKQGVYNRNKANRTSANLTDIVTYTYLYGYDLDLDDSNPATRVTYPSDVDNVNYTPAYMDFSANAFNYGGWNIAPGEKFMPRPCMLKYDGTVDHYLDPNNYAKKIDGTNSSVKSSSFAGNAMMEWPKIFTKRWEENGVYHFRCSDVKIDDDWDCWCNYDVNNNEIDHFYTAIYGGNNDSSNRIRSLSLNTYDSKLSSEYFFDYAKNNGDGWHVETTADFLLIQDLLVMMAKTTHTQTAYGRGNSSSGNTFITSGSMDTKGLFWGINNWRDGVKIFGMEHWWGNGARLLAGWLYKRSGNKYYFKVTRGTKDGTTCTDYNYTGSGYLTSPGPGSTYCDDTYHNINKTTTTPYGRLPLCDSKTSGSTVYECDVAYWKYDPYDTSAIHCATVGGNADMGDGNGAFSVVFNVAAGYGSYARISCKPSAQS